MRFGPGTSVSQLPPSTTADVLRALDQLQATARGIADAPEHHDVASLAELTEQVMDNLRPLVVLVGELHKQALLGQVGPVPELKQLPSWARELSDASQRWLLELDAEVLSSPNLMTAYMEFECAVANRQVRACIAARVRELDDKDGRYGR
jgi:hypothetical protein